MEAGRQILPLILVTILSIYVDEVSGLHCLSCTGVSQPRHCHSLEVCPDGQHCSAEKITNELGETKYNTGCMDSKHCSASHTTTRCVKCCEYDLCNSNLCGAPGYPSGTGPICFGCRSLPKGRQCNKIEFCQGTEVCFYKEYEEFGDVLIDSGCITQHGCTALKSDPNFDPGAIVGKRSENVRSLTNSRCTWCCDNNLCNKKWEEDPDQSSYHQRGLVKRRPSADPEFDSETGYR